MFKALIELSEISEGDSIGYEDILNFELSFAEYAQPIIAPKFNLIPEPEKADLCYFSNMHCIYPHDRGQNRAMQNGAEIADKIHRDFTR